MPFKHHTLRQAAIGVQTVQGLCARRTSSACMLRNLFPQPLAGVLVIASMTQNPAWTVK